MVQHATALGDRCASRAAMNSQAAIVSALLDKLEDVSAHSRLSVHIAETAARTDIERNPRLAFMYRAYLEAEFFPAAPPSWPR